MISTKKMRFCNAVLVLSTIALSAAPMVAQDSSAPPVQNQGGFGRGGRGGFGRMQERQLDMMTKQLNLTPDQVTQIKAINADEDTQLKALRDDTATVQADKRDKMFSIRKESRAKMMAVLTPDQKSQFEALQAKMRERRQERWQEHEGNSPASPPASQN